MQPMAPTPWSTPPTNSRTASDVVHRLAQGLDVFRDHRDVLSVFRLEFDGLEV